MSDRGAVDQGAVDRVAVIGDVGGHADDLERVLDELGCDPETGVMPEGLTVVQAGDLVDRGPESLRALLIAARMWRANPRRWVQILGNHEDYYRDDAHRVLPRSWNLLDETGVVTLRALVDTPMFRRAAAIEIDGETLLVTHATLGRPEWEALGAPATAVAARDAIDALEPEAYRELLHVKGRLQLASWTDGGVVPFGQVFGHFTPECVDQRIGGHRFVGVDVGLREYDGYRLRAFSFAGRAIEPPSVARGRALA